MPNTKLYVDTGAKGGIWNNCSLKQHIEGNTLNIPHSFLTNTDTEIPLHMFGDDAFPFCLVIIKPHSHRLYLVLRKYLITGYPQLGE